MIQHVDGRPTIECSDGRQPAILVCEHITNGRPIDLLDEVKVGTTGLMVPFALCVECVDSGNNLGQLPLTAVCQPCFTKKHVGAV